MNNLRGEMEWLEFAIFVVYQMNYAFAKK
jgi:hypothetical protein